MSRDRLLKTGTLGLIAMAIVAAAWMAVGGPSARDLVPSLYQESYSLEARGDTSEALAKARELLGLSPRDYVAHLRVGWLSYLDGKYDDAIKHYRKAVSLRPNAVEPKLGLMLPLMGAHRHKEAIAVADEILEKDPLNYLASSRRAFSLYLTGKHERAEREYREILDLYPSDVEMMSGLGWSLLKQGRCPEAIRIFEELVRIAPRHVTGNDGLAACEGAMRGREK